MAVHMLKMKTACPRALSAGTLVAATSVCMQGSHLWPRGLMTQGRLQVWHLQHQQVMALMATQLAASSLTTSTIVQTCRAYASNKSLLVL